jgi:cysteine desulfurase
MKTIYLDHAAGAPLDREVYKGMLPYFSSSYGNASSMHRTGRAARRVIDEARCRVAGVIGASPDEILFTGSGSEADVMAIMGCARAYRHKGNHIIISAIEHKAVRQAAASLAAEGFVVSTVPVDQYGCVDPQEVLSLVTDKTILISIMYANNEIGSTQPIEEIGTALKQRRGFGTLPLFHTDACQAAGYLPMMVHTLGVDLLTLNGSKIYGPTGVGMLYVRKGVNISPLIVGGEQEQGLRAGTECTPLIVGFSQALQKSEAYRESEGARLRILQVYFIESIKRSIPEATYNGHPTNRLPNNVHISIPCIEGESIVLMLDKEGIAASTGSACSARDLKPSHVLAAIGQDEHLMHGSIRFTMGRETTKADIDETVQKLQAIAERLSAVSALTSYVYAHA